MWSGFTTHSSQVYWASRPSSCAACASHIAARCPAQRAAQESSKSTRGLEWAAALTGHSHLHAACLQSTWGGEHVLMKKASHTWPGCESAAGVHHEQFWHTGNDAVDVVDRLRLNDDYARQIALAGTEFAKTYLVKEVMLVMLVWVWT